MAAQGWTRGCVAAVAALLALVGAPASAAVAADTGPATRLVTHKIVLPADDAWTDTGIGLRRGAHITLRASGVMRFGGSPIDKVRPTGIPRGDVRCRNAARPGRTMPAPELDCWALIASVGPQGTPFVVGNEKTFRAGESGALRLGLNDNWLSDNSGTWTITATIDQPAIGEDSRLPQIILISLAAVGIMWIGVRRFKRRKRRRKIKTFTLSDSLCATGFDVRVRADGSVVRLDADGGEQPITFEPDDFEDVHVSRSVSGFFWNGIELRVVRPRSPIKRAYGEAVQHGQCVAGSEGVKPTSDGCARGLLPSSIAPGWAFTLHRHDDATGEIEGRLRVFMLADRPLTEQTDDVMATFGKLHKRLAKLVARRPRQVVVDDRIGGSDGPRTPQMS